MKNEGSVEESGPDGKGIALRIRRLLDQTRFRDRL